MYLAISFEVLSAFFQEGQEVTHVPVSRLFIFAGRELQLLQPKQPDDIMHFIAFVMTNTQ
jgi:uncharacterized protein YqhQ